jgi:hypothetical protein
VNRLAQFLQYAQKVFRLNQLLRGVRCRRPYPEIPTRAVVLSLLLGVVLRVGSYLDLAQQTKRRRWQHLIHWAKRISHDSFEYVTERLHLEDLRQCLASNAKALKANKALESCKINGLLFLSLDANEHFASRSRCCACCCQREIEVLDEHGQKQTVLEYYHRYVFAQINGPKINVLLDVEPIRPGEAEAEAALRLLGRIRRVYGVRFFDAVTMDAWYVQGPFLKAVKKLGWMWQVVLKQERMEVLAEARQLSEGMKPDQSFYDETRERQVQLWAIKDLSFTSSYGRPVWVVHSEEKWTEKKIVGGEQIHQPQSSDWWWMLDDELKGYPLEMAYQAGHRRWGIENKAFNELTQHYHLEHCYHHEPVSMLAQMLILMLGFVLFSAYATLHSQPVRLGQMTMKALAHELDLALEEDLPWDLWFASG